MAKQITTETNYLRNTFGLLLALALMWGFGYVLWMYIKGKRASDFLGYPDDKSSKQPKYDDTKATVIGGQDDPAQPTSNTSIPPGGFLASHCKIGDLKPHVADKYNLYKSVNPNKAIAINNTCDHVAIADSRSSILKASQDAMASCLQYSPNRCAILAANDMVYS